MFIRVPRCFEGKPVSSFISVSATKILRSVIENFVDFKVFFEALPGNLFLLAPNPPQYTIVAVSDELLQLTGQERGEVVGKSVFEVYPDDAEARTAPSPLSTSLQEALQTKKPTYLPVAGYYLPGAGGVREARYWSARSKPVPDEQGEVCYIIHSVEDITGQSVRGAEVPISPRAEEKPASPCLDVSDTPLIREGVVTGAIHPGVDVTGQVAARQAIEASEARFRSLAQNSPDVITRHGKDYRYLYASPRIEGVTGIRAEDFPGKSYRELGMPEALCALFDAHLAHVFAHQALHTVEYALPGGKGYMHSRMVPEYNDAGEVISVLVLSTDISERKRAEENLRVSEEKYRTLFDSIDEGYYLLEVIFDARGEATDVLYLDANPAAIRMSGEDRRGKRLRDVGNDEPYWYALYGRVARTGVSERTEGFAKTTGIWVDTYTFKVGEAGNRVALVFQDVTARKRREANGAFLTEIADVMSRLSTVEEMMGTAGAKIAAYLNLAAVSFLDIDEAGGLIHVNYGWAQPNRPGVLGTYRMEEMGNQEWKRANRAGEMTILRDTQTDPRTNAASYAALRIGALVNVPFNRAGEWKFILSVCDTEARDWREDEIELCRELSNRIFPRLERARAEEALRTSEPRMQKAFSAETVGVLFFSLDGGIQDANEAFAGMSGYTRDELQHAVHWETLTMPECRDATARAAAALAEKGETAPYEKQLFRKDGSRWWGLFAPTRLSGSGLQSQCVEFIIDITERKRAEEALRHSEERYRMLFETMDEAYYVIEMLFDGENKPVDYRFLESNPAFEKLTGLQNAAGKTVRELVPEIEAFWIGKYGGVALTGEPARYSNCVAGLRNRWYDGYAFRLGGEESRLVAIIFSEITERKRREANQAFLAGITDEMSRLSTAEEIMTTVGAKIGAYLKVKTCLFVDVDDARGEVYVLDAWSSADVPSLRHQKIRLSDFIDEEFARANRSGEGAVVGDTGNDPRSSGRDYSALGIGSFVTIPFHRNGVWTNYLAVTESDPRDWREDEIELFRELSNRIFPRLERARAEEQLRRAAERDAFRVALNDALRPLTEPVEIQTAAMRVVGERLQVDRVLYAEIAGDGETILIADHYVRGDSPKIAGQFSASTFGSSRQILSAGQTFVCPDIDRDETLGEAEREAYRALGIVSCAVVPLVKKGRWVSNLGLYHSQPREWATEEIQLLQETAERTWAAVERAKAEAQLRELNQSLEGQVARRTAELQQSAALLQSVFDTTLMSMSVLKAVRDENGTIEDFKIQLANKELARETNRRDLAGKYYTKEFPGIKSAGLFALMLRVMETGEPAGTEYFYPYEGFDKWYSCQFVKLGDGLVATNLDITSRKQAEQELLKNYQILQQAEQVARMGSWEYDVATGSFTWSEGMYRLFGLPTGSPIRVETYLDYALAADLPVAAKIVRNIKQHHPFTETVRIRVNSQEVTLKIKAIEQDTFPGGAGKMLGVDVDLSEVKQLEQENLKMRLQQQQQLLNAILDAQEEERRRISESLHNGVGQTLFAAQLSLARVDVNPRPERKPEVAQALEKARQLLTEAMVDTRRASHELVPILLKDYGLLKAMEEFCSRFERTGIKLECHCFPERLSPPLEMALYRISQELVNNIFKHSGATRAVLEVSKDRNFIYLEAQDNGKGMEIGSLRGPAPGKGIGMRTMQDRVDLLGGRLEIDATPGKGTLVAIRVPLQP